MRRYLPLYRSVWTVLEEKLKDHLRSHHGSTGKPEKRGVFPRRSLEAPKEWAVLTAVTNARSAKRKEGTVIYRGTKTVN